MRGNRCVSAAAGVVAHTVLVLPCIIPMVGTSYLFASYLSPEEPVLLGGAN